MGKGRRSLKGENEWQTRRNNDDHHILRRGSVGDFEALNKRYVGYLLQEVQANKDVAAATRETWIENVLLRMLLKKHDIGDDQVAEFGRRATAEFGHDAAASTTSATASTTSHGDGGGRSESEAAALVAVSPLPTTSPWHAMGEAVDSKRVTDLYKALAVREPNLTDIPIRDGRLALEKGKPVSISQPYYTQRQLDKRRYLGLDSHAPKRRVPLSLTEEEEEEEEEEGEEQVGGRTRKAGHRCI